MTDAVDGPNELVAASVSQLGSALTERRNPGFLARRTFVTDFAILIEPVDHHGANSRVLLGKPEMLCLRE